MLDATQLFRTSADTNYRQEKNLSLTPIRSNGLQVGTHRVLEVY